MEDILALAKKVAEYFNAGFIKHHAFGTASVDFGKYKIDFATARKEYYPHWGSLPKVEPAGLKEDLFRRDFTINAMAISLNDDYARLIDFYNGLDDLRKGIIRIMHKNSFLEDPTRILRAVRFQQRFSFKMEKKTFGLLKEAIGQDALRWVNPHRLRDEVILILKEPRPYAYIKRINELAGFSFLDKSIKLRRSDFLLFLRLERAIAYYQEKFK